MILSHLIGSTDFLAEELAEGTGFGFPDIFRGFDETRREMERGFDDTFRNIETKTPKIW